MEKNNQLFFGKTICLGPIDHENDPPIIAQWSHNSDFLRLTDFRPVFPISEGQARKKLEQMDKEMEVYKTHYHFSIRLRSDDRLIGFAAVRWIEWTHAIGWVSLGIGDSHDRRKGYGTETLELLLFYAFNELNLHRLGAEMAEYNLGARHLFERCGFIEEVRRRQALRRAQKRWDILLYGLLRSEWEVRHA